MTKDDIPKLQQALQQNFPSVRVAVKVMDFGHRLAIGTDNRKEGNDRRRHLFLTPEGMSYTALDWTEWLHRATTSFRTQRVS